MGTDEVKHFNYCIPKLIQFDVSPKGARREPPAPGMEMAPYDTDEFERHPPILWSSSSSCIDSGSPFLSNKVIDCFLASADPSLRVIVTKEKEAKGPIVGSLFQCGVGPRPPYRGDLVTDIYQYQLGYVENRENGWEFKLRDIPWEVAAAHFLFDPDVPGIYTWASRYTDNSLSFLVQENEWIDGSEIQHFIETVGQEVLPSISDYGQRKSVELAVTKALIHAASPEYDYIGVLDAETSDFLRQRMQISNPDIARDAFPSAETYAKYADRLETPGSSIKLMALGSGGRGGYLPESGEILFTLPTKPRMGYVELDLAAIAADGEEAARKELPRDWGVVVKHWRAEGRLNFRSPNLGKLQKAGKVHFGRTDVPVYTAGDPQTFGLAGSYGVRSLQDKIERVVASMGEKYLNELARRGVREIVFVSNETLKKILDASASTLARQGAAIMTHDLRSGIALLKQAAGKFTVQPGGIYDEDERRIYLSSPYFLLHEMAHADEAVRKRIGILDRETLTLANEVQNRLIQSGDTTVSDHPEVLEHSPSGAEERRADGMVVYWTDSDKLKQVDPDLFNYFSTILHAFEKEKKIGGERLVKYADPFSRRYGNLTRWALQNDIENAHEISCLLYAGEMNDWLVEEGAGYPQGPLQCSLKTPSIIE